MSAVAPLSAEVGTVVADLEISRAWLVDPASGREGPGEIVVTDGTIEAVTWLEGDEASGIDEHGVVVAPGFVDLHVHLREPGNEDAETVASGLAAAAHGGFTTICAMPNTTPALDDPAVLARVRDAARGAGSPVEVLAWGAITKGRDGAALAALGELADAGVVGFSDDGSGVASAPLLRNALAYAGSLGLPIVEHAEDASQTEGAEANDGFVATVLGLRGWPSAAEESAVARDLSLLADVVRDVPSVRLHLTHLSTAGSLDLVRRAKAAGLPVTCDVTPHHLALTDEWLAGARRWAWDADGDPWADERAAIVAAPYASSLRVNPPLRSPADAAACREALLDGTADAIATDHAPHTSVDKDVEFGLASNGISGLETALGVVLALVDAGLLPLRRAIEALTTGPARVLARSWADRPRPGLAEGAPADLVVFDRSATWTPSRDALASRGKNTPLLGRGLSGVVLLTVAAGRLAYEAPGD
ncbi:MAG TPA: dihydroorotase, partial [Candidatus Limnocylindrales bacterium]|nr:dihydroorotase [Candidatus Limnocylindrales bacterium]